MFPILTGSNRLSTNPVVEPKKPTTIKKPKFNILTAVPDVILVFVMCKTGTSKDERLAFPAKMQNIIGISADLISSLIRMQIVSNDIKVIIEAPFKNITLWLWHILHTEALTMLNTAATIAITDNIVAAFPEVILQKSSRNFLPITVCITYEIPKLQQAKLKRFRLCFLCKTKIKGKVLSFAVLFIFFNSVLGKMII